MLAGISVGHEVDPVGFEQVSMALLHSAKRVGIDDLMNIPGRKETVGSDDHASGLMPEASMHIIVEGR